ncbi:hypothetical protein EGI26_10520 [Lacihabitans sp. CCS-44]|uniref:hypothetical protein n=1 Tax=Lacihabitans sp. CCS-44 TaxID=2487331 RepID=UPI0020CC792F|nr:hypothetical protein [Lacihabitans sp. CCS-44]MCP9755589.1 hypothetical protein [Lacihabitans sp. CCS-44]
MKKGIKITIYGLASLFVAFVVYANSQPKPLHAYAKDSQLSVYQLKKPATEQDLQKINDELEQVQGISAVAGNTESQMLSVVFHPNEITETDVKKWLSEKSISFEKADFTTVGPPAAECPVPHEYIMGFQKIKYALNFR